jgi:hypothetical protein
VEGVAVKLAKTCRYLVRVRDYETAHIEVGAEISHHDVGFTDERWAQLSVKSRNDHVGDIRAVLNHEVDRLAREELETIAEWSEISPNLAQDYLDTYAPPTPMQRKPHAKKTGTNAPSSRGIRRGAAASTSASAGY